MRTTRTKRRVSTIAPEFFCSTSDAVRRWSYEGRSGQGQKQALSLGTLTSKSYELAFTAFLDQTPCDARRSQHLGFHECQASQVQLQASSTESQCSISHLSTNEDQHTRSQSAFDNRSSVSLMGRNNTLRKLMASLPVGTRMSFGRRRKKPMSESQERAAASQQSITQNGRMKGVNGRHSCGAQVTIV